MAKTILGILMLIGTVWWNVVEPIDLGRLPQAATALSSYGSSHVSLSRPKASITYRGERG